MIKIKTAVIVYLFLLCKVATGQESLMDDYSPLHIQKLIAVAKANYPKAKTFDVQLEISKNKLSGEKVSWLEPFSFSYLLRSNNNLVDIQNPLSPQFLTGYQFGVSVNPGSLLKKPFNIKNAKQEVKLALLEKEEYDLQLEGEVKRRYLQYLQSMNALRLHNKMVIDAESTFKQVKIQYEKSELSFQQYNEASLSLSNSYLLRIQAETALLTTKASLEELLVMKLEEIK